MNYLTFNQLKKVTLTALILVVAFTGCKKDDDDEPQNQAPAITIETPENNTTIVEGDSVVLTCIATDHEDGQLDGENIVWSSNHDGQLGTDIILKTNTLSVNTHRITASATDSENLTTTDTITIIVIDDEIPTVSILSPASNATYEYYESIDFKCIATDVEDGNLHDNAIVWVSDTDGQLGIGDSLMQVSLSPGTHQITVTATDSKGNAGTATVSVMINPNNTPTVTISRPFTNYTYMAGEVELKCNATDIEDGSLTAENIRWTSNIDGELGTGTETTATLTAGSHTIIVTATDSYETTNSDTVYIDVTNGPLTLEIMVKWMIGSYSSAAQAATSNDPYHYDVRRKTALIWENNKDGYWLYLEQAYAESQNNPYFQRIYHFYYEDGIIKNTIYALNNASSFVGSWATPEDFDAIGMDDITERPNCGLTFEINADHVYGETSGTSCTSSIPNVAYMSSEQWVYDTQWHSYDLGYNSQGVIVMGPYSPYIFDKVD